MLPARLRPDQRAAEALDEVAHEPFRLAVMLASAPAAASQPPVSVSLAARVPLRSLPAGSRELPEAS